VRLRM